MTRKQKIQLLESIQSGKVSLEEIRPKPILIKWNNYDGSKTYTQPGKGDITEAEFIKLGGGSSRSQTFEIVYEKAPLPK